jgi:hypothetical protein
MQDLEAIGFDLGELEKISVRAHERSPVLESPGDAPPPPLVVVDSPVNPINMLCDECKPIVESWALDELSSGV